MPSLAKNSSLGRSRELIFILALFSALAPLSIDMYLPALPQIGRDFGVSTASVQHTLASFFIGFAIGQAFFGPIADRYGRKLPLAIAFGLFIIASIACAYSQSVDNLMIWRFVQALGGCAGAVIGRAMVRDLFDPKDAPRIYASLMLVIGLAPMLAPLAGGWVLAHLEWHAIFWILAGAGILCLVLLLWRIPETSQHRIAGGPINALINYGKLFKDRCFMGFTLAASASMAAIFAYVSGASFVFIQIHGVSAQNFGWIFLINALGMVIAAQINGHIFSRRFNTAKVLKIAQILQAIAGVALLVMAFGNYFGMIGLMVPLFFLVSLNGVIAPSASALAMAPQGAKAGTASALLGTLQFSFGALAAVMVGLFQQSSAMAMAGVITFAVLLAPLISAYLLRKNRQD